MYFASFSHGCCMALRAEIVEIVGDSYDPKRSPLKGVAFNTTFYNAGGGFFYILTMIRVTKCNILSHSTVERHRLF